MLPLGVNPEGLIVDLNVLVGGTVYTIPCDKVDNYPYFSSRKYYGDLEINVDIIHQPTMHKLMQFILTDRISINKNNASELYILSSKFLIYQVIDKIHFLICNRILNSKAFTFHNFVHYPELYNVVRIREIVDNNILYTELVPYDKSIIDNKLTLYPPTTTRTPLLIRLLGRYPHSHYKIPYKNTFKTSKCPSSKRPEILSPSNIIGKSVSYYNGNYFHCSDGLLSVKHDSPCCSKTPSHPLSVLPSDLTKNKIVYHAVGDFVVLTPDIILRDYIYTTDYISYPDFNLIIIYDN